MVRRFPNKYKQRLYNVSGAFRLNCSFRKTVAPGTTFSSLSQETNLTSIVLDEYRITPLLCEQYFFYVPYRLVWGQWVDFIGSTQEDDGALTVPTHTNAMPACGDFLRGDETTPFQVLNRRAYKLIYNQYFGDDQITDKWYDLSSVFDGQTSAFSVRGIDDWFKHTRSQAAITDMLVDTVDNNGTPAIDLNTFRRTYREYYSRLRTDLTGDKYVDVMRAMGVELNWQVQMAPEFLGVSRKLVKPMDIQSTAGADLSPRAVKYKANLQCKLNKKAFAEHGVVMGLTCFRPVTFSEDEELKDGRITTRQQFYTGDAENVYQSYEDMEYATERYAHYLKSPNVARKDSNVYVTITPNAGYATELYPDPSTVGFTTNSLVQNSTTTVHELTPIRPGGI